MLRSIFVSLAILAAPTLAHANEIYEIKNVSVAVVEPDTNKARDKAFVEGQKKAYELLQKRLTENGYITQPQPATTTQIQNAVKAIDIVSEKITAKEYRASYNISFNEAQVSKLFKIAPIKEVVEKDKFLVIPIVLEKTGVRLWKNDWRKTWDGLKNDDVVLPLGDLQDVQNLKNEDIAANKYDGIFRMQKRYAASSVVLIQAEYVENTTSLQVQLERIKNNDRTVINYEYPGGNGITAKDLFDAAAADLAYRLQNDKLTDEEAVATPALPPAELPPLVPAQATTEQHLPLPPLPSKAVEPYSPMAPGAGFIGQPQAATQPNAVEAAPAAGIIPNQIAATVIAPDLIAWNRIRNKIIVSHGVNDLQIKSFTSGQASVTISYTGDIQEIAQVLDTKGLLLSGSGNNWQITEK